MATTLLVILVLAVLLLAGRSTRPRRERPPLRRTGPGLLVRYAVDGVAVLLRSSAGRADLHTPRT